VEQVAIKRIRGLRDIILSTRLRLSAHSVDSQKERDSVLINDLRQLRLDVRRLNSSLVERLTPFQKPDGSFKTSPDSKDSPIPPDFPPNATDFSVGSTCTVLMAAIGAGREEELFAKTNIPEIFKKSVRLSKWGSSGLKDGNAFTTAMLVRCAGVIVKANLMSDKDVKSLRHEKFPGNEGVAEKTVEEIVRTKAAKGKVAFAVDEYPAKTTHAYWFIDGLIGMNIKLAKSIWEPIASWAAGEFHRQLIYVSAENDALMDPPALAMAACVINRIRRMTDEEENRELAEISRDLPSLAELEFGIRQVFSKQADSGIWHKYFPLFHFPSGQGAADYCFSFEFLEAILVEFGTAVLREPGLLKQVALAVQWCDAHELSFTESTKTYRGWNAGGAVSKLAEGMSESWATGSVHMFLTQLDRRIGDLLDELVLKRFGFDRRAVPKSTKKFDSLIDVELEFQNEGPTTLKRVVQNEMLETARKMELEELLKEGLPVPRSALLFGPPGTSKTRLAKAIAEYLEWPLIVITPSEFLGNGLEQVHAQVDERFRDLMDLRMAVVFFDEMDALAQTREGDDFDEGKKGLSARVIQLLQQNPRSGRGGVLDVTRQLLTTSMLPKLTNLWDQKRVIFLMATNHKQQLDPAITRPNRFDLLLCVAPPSWDKKCAVENLAMFLPTAEQSKEISKEEQENQESDKREINKELLRLAPLGSDAAKRLDVFTVAEVGIFLDHLRRQKDRLTLLEALKEFKDVAAFGSIVDDWAATSITLRTGSRTLAEFEKDVKETRRQYYPGQE
jgi:AAA+ superfamily predicted ATPase